jgi:hypothetical protein
LFMFCFTVAVLVFDYLGDLQKLAQKRGALFKIHVSILFLTLTGMPSLMAQVNYGIDGGAAYVSASSSASGNLVIASTYNGYPVTSMDDYAFYNCNRLTNIVIPDSITNIGEYTFTACFSLTNVIIGGGVTVIGPHAFELCYALKNISIPANIISIGDDAFNECYALTNIVIADGVTSFGSGVFQQCWDLTSVIIPNSVTNLGTGTFLDCYGLTNVALSDHLANIGADTFENCSNLVNLTIPSSISSMSSQTFINCPRLAGIIFLGNAPSLSGPAFAPMLYADVYYYYGTSGWGATYGNRPTVGLFAPPQIVQGSAYLQSNDFSFAITGVNSQTVVVESSTNLVDWEPIWTNTLSGASSIFTDLQEGNYSQRFYRAR